jgi:phosphate/sulfate permease
MNITKKVLIIAMILLIFLANFSIAFATTNTVSDSELLENSETATELYEIKENVGNKLEEYVEQYGSYAYGVAAYILNTVRIYSIPFCFVGIVVGSIYQYMLGIRKLDIRDKGFALIISFVTILLICQVLPLIFTIVVNGWRG